MACTSGQDHDYRTIRTEISDDGRPYIHEQCSRCGDTVEGWDCEHVWERRRGRLERCVKCNTQRVPDGAELDDFIPRRFGGRR